MLVMIKHLHGDSVLVSDELMSEMQIYDRTNDSTMYSLVIDKLCIIIINGIFTAGVIVIGIIHEILCENEILNQKTMAIDE